MKSEDLHNANNQYIIWGCGEYLNRNIRRIPKDLHIVCACDSDRGKWGKSVTEREIVCCSPEIINSYPNAIIIIAIKKQEAVEEIKKNLDKMKSIHLNELIKQYQPYDEERKLTRYHEVFDKVSEVNDKRLRYFISVSVPVEACQLHCEYCYIGQNGGFHKGEEIPPTANYIRAALSKKRLGGIALINFCGAGETLLYPKLFDIILSLLEEGHYISIITNCLLDKAVHQYISLKKCFAERIFFKCSLHYRQLKQNNMLNKFARNVKSIAQSYASFSVEMVPEDELIDEIDEIKQYSIENFGALPHLTIARDEQKEDIPIITKLTNKDYVKVWNEFHSSMFEMKMRQRVKHKEYCLSGKNSFMFSLDDGVCYTCPYGEKLGSIYADIDKKINFQPVGYACERPFCINDHAYIALGLLVDIEECSYMENRDRITIDGKHWVKEPVASLFGQKIYKNI